MVFYLDMNWCNKKDLLMVLGLSQLTCINGRSVLKLKMMWELL